MKPLLAAVALASFGTGLVYPASDFRHDAIATVVIVSNPDTYCGNADAGKQYRGCVITYHGGAKLMVVPNPCPLAHIETYAGVVCHELKHWNGWPANHTVDRHDSSGARPAAASDPEVYK